MADVETRNPLSPEAPKSETFHVDVAVPPKISRGEGQSFRVGGLKLGDLLVFPIVNVESVAAGLGMKDETVAATIPVMEINDVLQAFNEVLKVRYLKYKKTLAKGGIVETSVGSLRSVYMDPVDSAAPRKLATGKGISLSFGPIPPKEVYTGFTNPLCAGIACFMDHLLANSVRASLGCGIVCFRPNGEHCGLGCVLCTVGPELCFRDGAVSRIVTDIFCPCAASKPPIPYVEIRWGGPTTGRAK